MTLLKHEAHGMIFDITKISIPEYKKIDAANLLDDNVKIIGLDTNDIEYLYIANNRRVFKNPDCLMIPFHMDISLDNIIKKLDDDIPSPFCYKFDKNTDDLIKIKPSES